MNKNKIYEIQVKTNSKKEGVEVLATGVLKVCVNTQPIDNQANIRVVEVLSDYFSIAKSKIEIIKGHKSKNKKVIVY